MYWRLDVLEEIRDSVKASLEEELSDDSAFDSYSFYELVPRKLDDRYQVIDRQGNTIEIRATDGCLLDGNYENDNLKDNELADEAILILDQMYNNNNGGN